ncbi:uncharacterized protein LOC112568921 isoform X2 [Pomacea canaliculata]|uniref:uncharacterized protein LOC112568921 isoform X2 n=1 Tax=Pomacea canaliculata TaxID=400727 RepID=UPI000D72D715|nr:uncharacterized protein LOC112568921 isoform X2 [Pomacea canaliculata]
MPLLTSSLKVKGKNGGTSQRAKSSDVLSQSDGNLTCPDKWQDQENVTLTCEILATSVNSTACPQGSGDLLFDFIPPAGSQTTFCSIFSYLNAGCNGIFNVRGCRCSNKTSDTYIFEYKFTASRTTFAGGIWKCIPSCYDSNFGSTPKNIDPIGNCINVQFLTTTPLTTTVTTTTKAVTTTVTKSTTSEVIFEDTLHPCPVCDPSGYLKWWLILIIAVGAICLSASLILVILTVQYWNPNYLTRKVWWFILLMVLACICVLGIIIVVIILLKWKEKLCFKKTEFSPPRQQPNKNGQNGPGNAQKPPKTPPRPLPVPSKDTSIELNSATDLPVPSPGRQPLPPISGSVHNSPTA